MPTAQASQCSLGGREVGGLSWWRFPGASTGAHTGVCREGCGDDRGIGLSLGSRWRDGTTYQNSKTRGRSWLWGDNTFIATQVWLLGGWDETQQVDHSAQCLAQRQHPLHASYNHLCSPEGAGWQFQRQAKKCWPLMRIEMCTFSESVCTLGSFFLWNKQSISL